MKNKTIKTFNEHNDNVSVMQSIVRELEDLQWELHKKKEDGTITKEEFDGYGLCMLKLKMLLQENNINY